MDAREWRGEIADAIDYYNGMGFDEAKEKGIVEPYADSLYAGHDTRSGVKVSNGPVRRNQIADDKPASARMRAKEVGGETRRTRTESGYKAFSRASQQWMAKPQP